MILQDGEYLNPRMSRGYINPPSSFSR